ncbi:LysR family transcriptional regulator [Phenylobacterium montanum]|uniref:LysR family transcriptional regulator n=1 Tax=Phenylobacterium montanum TaxID=2823693 RepID=A0A975IU70_9CAUL|nr:LysR family transcriptional regulator [Caulobacter sp. S6]QUD85936.1 LysR family transcriptional regulator [Caulobacter sp. S6]
MRFKGLDLNLLVCLDVLLDERSVSAAARRLHLSQPATSAALARLREFFDDEILVGLGKSMYPTPFAEGLRPQVRECLKVADGIVSSSSVFDPATSQRAFRIIASDSVTSSILAPLLSRLASLAPRIGFDLIFPDPASQAEFQRGDVDLLISPEGFMVDEYPTELFFEEQHVIVGWRDNPLFQGEVTEEKIFRCGHVAVAIGPQRILSFADRQAELLGRSRRVEVRAASFAMAPLFLVGSERLAIMHGRLAETMTRQFPIAYAPLPFPFPPLRQMIHHHPSRANDEGVRWLLQELRIQAQRPRPFT